MQIRLLRTRAEQALGDKFDIRAFHTEVLKDGAVPLNVLEQKVDRWHPVATESRAISIRGLAGRF